MKRLSVPRGYCCLADKCHNPFGVHNSFHWFHSDADVCDFFLFGMLGHILMSGKSDGHRLLCDNYKVLLIDLPADVGKKGNSY